MSNMSQSDSVIVLHTMKYGDSGLILHCYSASKGRQGYLLRGLGKKGASGKVNILHPLAVLDIQTYSGSSFSGKAPSLINIKELSIKHRLDSIRTDIYKNSISLFVSEVLYRSLLESDADERLFSFLEYSVLLLENVRNPFANFHLHFLIKYLTIIGFEPKKGYEMEYTPFSADEKQILDYFHSHSFEQCMSYSLSGETRNTFIQSLIRYMEYHIGIKIDIKSLEILHQVFAS